VQYVWKLAIAAGLVGGGIFAAIHFGAGSGRGSGPYAGTWKVWVLQPGKETVLGLLRVGGDEAKPTVEMPSAPDFDTTEVVNVRVEDGTLNFNLKTDRETYPVVIRAPKPGAGVDRLIGSLRDRESYEMLRLERTGLRKVDGNKKAVALAGHDELRNALQAPGLKDKENGVRDVLKKYADEPVAITALLVLLQLQIEAGAPLEESKATADRYLALAAEYGRGVELQSTAQLVRGLSQLPPERAGTLAMEYSRRAEKLLTGDDPPALTAGVYKSLARALRAAGKDDEAKEVDGRAAELYAKLDAEFGRKAVPFRPAPPAGRRGGGDRVVLAELFTGVQCPPCVAADVAFDAALQVYKPSQVVFLQYHEHVPAPDPLTSPASEARLQYYSEVHGTPSFLLDGRFLNEPIGGPVGRGEPSYLALHAALDRAMDSPSGARLKLTARRIGNDLELTAEVSELSQPGERTRLRFVLAEEVVRYYAAPNGQRLHHHVVRDFPGGVEGTPLPEKAAKRTVKVSIPAVRKELEGYLDLVASKQPFPDDDRPLDLRQFKAVAFVQDDTTKQVLQAAQVDVPETN
jgi:hypothetical protein